MPLFAAVCPLPREALETGSYFLEREDVMRLMKLAVVVLTLMLVLPLTAQAGENPNTFRGTIGYFMPTGNYELDNLKLEAGNAVGWGVSYEREITELIGLEFSVLWSTYDMDFKFDVGRAASDEVSVMPILLGANFHVVKNDKCDFYLGPLLGWVTYDNFSFTAVDLEHVSFRADNDFAWGAQLGFDVPIGTKGWGLSGVMKYIGTAADAKIKSLGGEAPTLGVNWAVGDTVKVDINPWIFQAGAHYRF